MYSMLVNEPTGLRHTVAKCHYGIPWRRRQGDSHLGPAGRLVVRVLRRVSMFTLVVPHVE